MWTALERRKQKIREFFYFDVTYYRNTSLYEEKSTNYTTIMKNIKMELYSKVRLVKGFIEMTQLALLLFSALVVVS